MDMIKTSCKKNMYVFSYFTGGFLLSQQLIDRIIGMIRLTVFAVLYIVKSGLVYRKGGSDEGI